MLQGIEHGFQDTAGNRAQADLDVVEPDRGGRVLAAKSPVRLETRQRPFRRMRRAGVNPLVQFDRVRTVRGIELKELENRACREDE